jgi:hypothetical protein
MTSINCQKVVLKALGHILYGSNFIASDVNYLCLQWFDQFQRLRLGCSHRKRKSCEIYFFTFVRFLEICVQFTPRLIDRRISLESLQYQYQCAIIF